MRRSRDEGKGSVGAARVMLAAIWVTAVAVLAFPAFATAAGPLSISVVGNHFVNGEGQTIRLLGVNRTSSEYGCVDGFGYDDGHFDAADVAAIASWDATAVRVPLNEDCWLGINGQPNSSQGADPPLTRDGYRQEIERYVGELNAHGIYAILDLHWTAPGAQVAFEQQPMPDFDHSPAFWTSVATTFKNDPGVVFDLFNEPYDPTDPRSGEDANPQDKVTWNCWETGTHNGPAGGTACETSAYDENGTATSRYRIAGMQTLLDAVRATGATQPVMVGGLNFSNDLSLWATHAPDDPLNQEAASFHNYMGQACSEAACWDSQIAPVAAAVPVVTGEFAEENFENPACADHTPNSFDQEYMDWADQHGVSYLAWAWIVPSPAEIAAEGCSAYYLIKDYGYTPAGPNGTAVLGHLLSLAGTPPPPPPPPPPPGSGSNAPPTQSPGTSSPAPSKSMPTATISLTTFHAQVEPGGKEVVIKLGASESCKGTLIGLTAKRFAVPGSHRRRPISLGSANFKLTAGKTKTVTLDLPASARSLLKAKGPLAADFTVTLTAPDASGTTHRAASLKEPAVHHQVP